MKKIMYLMLVVLLTACGKLFVKNTHDGVYKGGTENFYALWTINGDELIIEAPLIGISKVKCTQFDDYIEYTDANGIVKIAKITAEGNLQISNLIELQKIK